MKTSSTKKILQHVFWDSDASRLDLLKNKRVIIERILMFGRQEQIVWLLENYSRKDISDIVKKSKVLDRKTANFWAIHFNINRKEIQCFSKQLTNPFYN